MDVGERLAYLPLDDALVGELFPELTPEERSEHWHLLTSELEDLTRGVGLIALAGELRLTGWLARAFTWLRAERLLDWFDSVLRRVKAKMGKLVPDVDGPHRYP